VISFCVLVLEEYAYNISMALCKNIVMLCCAAHRSLCFLLTPKLLQSCIPQKNRYRMLEFILLVCSSN